MLLSTTDDDVLSAAKELGEELTQTQSEATESEFEEILVQCNEAISEGIGIQYDDACDAGGCC
ncbi:halo-CC-star protein HcsS [Halocatena marina]|uniref:Halo-CC-star protein HcsS n=1 Tax=Halocatena marina TaxID=2934937 RepID=A0ABD5YZI5_9EURY|nr:halo-CC-star protein HcsS [Halocatena marina]